MVVGLAWLASRVPHQNVGTFHRLNYLHLLEAGGGNEKQRITGRKVTLNKTKNRDAIIQRRLNVNID